MSKPLILDEGSYSQLPANQSLDTDTLVTGASGGIVHLSHIAQYVQSTSSVVGWKITTPFEKGKNRMLLFTLEGYSLSDHDIVRIQWCVYLYGNHSFYGFNAKSTGTVHSDTITVAYDNSNRMCFYVGAGIYKYYTGIKLDCLVYFGDMRESRKQYFSNKANWSITVPDAADRPSSSTTWANHTLVKTIDVQKPNVATVKTDVKEITYNIQATDNFITAAGGWTAIPHGLDGTKIKDISVAIQLNSSAHVRIPPEHSHNANCKYSIGWDVTNIFLSSASAGSATALHAGIAHIFITYKV